MEKEKFKCPNCEHEITMNLNEFVDVSTDPEFKEKIMNGEFFLIKCPECGDETLVEYPVMYMDPDKKLTIYMAPEHEADLLEQLNSLEVPEGDLDEEADFSAWSETARSFWRRSCWLTAAETTGSWSFTRPSSWKT